MNFENNVFSHSNRLKIEFLDYPGLLQAYCRTDYCIEYAGEHFNIQIGQVSEEADKLLHHILQNNPSPKGIALIGAENPHNEKLSPKANAKRHEAFKNLLYDAGLWLADGEGRAQSENPEGQIHSERFCVAGPVSLKQAIALSQGQQQVAFVYVLACTPAQLHITGRVSLD
ncbi:MAG: hypothetical protein R3194_11320 [Limnobacter sp.]|nr:hypothetical protein [Limnobacter sp.]